MEINIWRVFFYIFDTVFILLTESDFHVYIEIARKPGQAKKAGVPLDEPTITECFT